MSKMSPYQDYGHVTWKHILYVRKEPLAGCVRLKLDILQIVVQHAHCYHLPLLCLEPIYDILPNNILHLLLCFPICPLPHIKGVLQVPSVLQLCMI